jgi:hypothetical protein
MRIRNPACAAARARHSLGSLVRGLHLPRQAGLVDRHLDSCHQPKSGRNIPYSRERVLHPQNVQELDVL